MPPASVGVCRERRATLVEMRKPSESYAKKLLGLGATVPVSLFDDEHAAAEGRMTMSRDSRSVSGDLRFTQVWALARACSTL